MSTNILAQATQTATTAIPVQSGDFWSFMGDAGWWQVILAVVALIVGGVLFLLQFNRKRLTYHLVSDTPFITIGEIAELSNRLEITFDKQPVESLDIRSMIIRLSNSGNTEIDDKDWRGPVTFDFGDKAEALTAEIIDPKKHKERAKAVGSRIELEPILLNKRQAIIIKALIRQPNSITHDSAIKGVELTREYTSAPRSSYLVAATCAAISIPTILLLSVLGTDSLVVGCVGLYLGIIGTAIILWYDRIRGWRD